LAKTAKQIFNETVKDDKDNEKSNFTFYLDKKLTEQMKRKCKAEKTSLSKVIENFFKDILGK